jgi:hypothetical protein
MIAAADAPAVVALFKTYFLNRTDRACFGAPWGSPCPCRGDHFLDGLLLAHLLGDDVTAATAEWGPTQQGKSGKERGAFKIGSYAPALDGTSRFGTIDLDGGEDHASPLRDPLAAALAVLAGCVARGLPAYLEKSGSGRGWHVWLFFGPGCRARDVRALLHSLVPSGLPLKGKNAGVADATKGAGIEIFPKSDALGSDPLSVGHQVWLPLYHGGRNGGGQFYQAGDDGKPAAYLPDTFETIDAAGLAAALASGVGPPPAPGPGAGPLFDREGRGATSDATLAEVAAAPEALPQEHCDDYETWAQTGMALKDLDDGTDGERFALWEEWSRKSERFREGACAKHWKTFGRRASGARRTVASLFREARANGWEPEPIVIVVADTAGRSNHHDSGAAVGATKQAAPTVGGTSERWDEPIPFDRMPAVPAFPTDTLTPWLREWVKGVAEELQVPEDLPGMTCLGVASGAAAKKFHVFVRPGFVEGCNLYAVAQAEVAERKTAVFDRAMGPVKAYEEAQLEAAQAEIATRRVERQMLQQALRAAEHRARTAAATSANPENGTPAMTAAEARRQARAEAIQIAGQLANLVVPEPPQYVADDATPEALAEVLDAQGGRILVASDEGSAFEIAKGRYSDGPNFEIWLRGHTGGDVRVNRTGRGPLTGRGRRGQIHVKGATISAAMVVQPDVVASLADKPALFRRGWAARWLFSVVVGYVGRRKTNPDPAPEKVLADYHSSMLALWGLQVPKGGTELVCSDEARKAFEDFLAWMEPRLPAYPVRLKQWAGKLVGASARIAGILHLADAVGASGSVAAPVSGTTAANAIRLAKEYLLPHARAAFALMGTSELVADAMHALKWIRGHHKAGGEARLSKRDIFRGCEGHWPTVAELEPVLRLLEQHHYLKALPPSERPGPGRRPSVEYLVNPRGLIVTCTSTQSTQSTE